MVSTVHTEMIQVHHEPAILACKERGDTAIANVRIVDLNSIQQQKFILLWRDDVSHDVSHRLDKLRLIVHGGDHDRHAFRHRIFWVAVTIGSARSPEVRDNHQ